VVYLGKDVSDEAFEQACSRAAEAAGRMFPLEGTLHGRDQFEASESSGGKIPVFVPAYIPGIGALRGMLEDLSASEHKDYRPHVTLGYYGEDEKLPPPHSPARVRFTQLHVRRGDEVMSYPLGQDSSLPARQAAVGEGAFYWGSRHEVPPGTDINPETANEAGRNWLQSSEKKVYYTDDPGVARAYWPHVYRVQPLAPPSGRGRDRKRLHDPEPGFPREYEYESSRGFRVLNKMDPDAAQAAWDDRTARRWKSRGGQEAIQRIVDRDGPEGLPESALPHYRPRGG
jgi:hypothetical protein